MLISYIRIKESCGQEAVEMGRRKHNHQAMTPHHLPLLRLNSQFQGEEMGLPGHDKVDGGW